MRVFMAEDNICAQNLLHLVSHGNAVIAELLRLKDHIPAIFHLHNKDVQQKYQDIIMDFSYFKVSDAQEKKISSNMKLQELDDDTKEINLELIARIYLSMESVYEYASELNSFIEQLNEGKFIQQSLDTVIQDPEGKQLLCESLYLYGCMLLLVDVYVSGPTRERLLVAFYRYSTSQSQSNVDAVCQLLRDTGYGQQRRPQHYPVEYFSRVPMNEEFVDAVISKLRSEDIYNQLNVYPVPDQRSTALATQASMLFVCLFFSPGYLHSDMTAMREIVDKFFLDNWVISVYMGATLNIVDFWDGFKAAKTALTNVCNSKSVKALGEKYGNKVPILASKIQNLLKEGILTDDVVLDDTNKLISLLRESNVSIRWIILHTSQPIFTDNCKKSKQLKDLVVKETDCNCPKLLELLISTAELELKFREILRSLLEKRSDSWTENKKKALDGLADLTELLSGYKPASKIPECAQLKQWFDSIAKQVSSLGDTITSKSTKKVVQLLQALDKVVEFHGIRNASSVLQTHSEVQGALKSALRTSNLREDSLVALEVITDVSYAWCSVDVYTIYMQAMIKERPSVTSRLRALFLKLASAMEIPLLRINQARSDDLISVSQYYSCELVVYIKKVLQVIPEMVFNILAKIIEIQTWKLKEVPTRLEKERLREFAQLEERMEVAKLTHSASTFTKGILDMRTTLVGVVRIDPAQLLEDGLLRELARHINSKFQEVVEGSTGKRGGHATSLTQRVQTLASSIDGYKRSLEYIQDYINIHGLRIWQKEMTRIINSSVSAEVSARRGVALTGAPAGFMGSLARQVAQLCDARHSTYIDVRAAWFDNKTHAEVVDNKTFEKLHEALGPAGLHGLDALYSFMINNQLQSILELKEAVAKEKSWSDLNKTSKNNILRDVELVQQMKSMQGVVDALVCVGTLQTLRRHVAHQLSSSAKFHSGHLEASLNTMNEALMHELKQDSKTDTKPRVSVELLRSADDLLTRCGHYNPHEKIYIKGFQERLGWDVDYILALVIISQMSRLQLCSSTGDLIARRPGEHLDGQPLLVGTYTILRQCRDNLVPSFVDYVCLLASEQAYSTLKMKPPEIAQETSNVIRLLEHFCHTFNYPFNHIENKLPMSLMDISK